MIQFTREAMTNKQCWSYSCCFVIVNVGDMLQVVSQNVIGSRLRSDPCGSSVVLRSPPINLQPQPQRVNALFPGIHSAAFTPSAVAGLMCVPPLASSSEFVSKYSHILRTVVSF